MSFTHRSLTTTGNSYCLLMRRAGKAAYANGVVSFDNKLIGQYHSQMKDADKQRILDAFRSGKYRCLICTVAFGMGVNISDVDIIIHWGESDTTLEYWQEVGRAGRDSREAKAILYSRPVQLAHCQQDMKDFKDKLNASLCIRKCILGEFCIGDLKAMDPKAECSAELCNSDCKCDQCMCCSSCRDKCKCRKTE